MALKLIVADFGAQNVYLLDPVKGTGTTVSVGGVPGFTNSGPARVSATSTQTVFVGLSGEGGSSGACSTCLAQMNLTVSPPTIQPAPQPQVTSLTGAPLVQGTAAGDHVLLPSAPLRWSRRGVECECPESVRHFRCQCLHYDLGAASDGSLFASQARGTIEIRAADLSLTSVPTSTELEQIPGRVLVPVLLCILQAP